MNIKNIADIAKLAKGFCWQSKAVVVGDIRFILFALATGDWNKIHINPFTAWRYKSNLNGLACCGDLVLGLTKHGIHKIFHFTQDVEIVALGYSEVAFKRPLNLGMHYQYSYTLMQSSVKRNCVYCTWLIEMKNLEGDIIASATWKMFYAPVARRAFVAPAVQTIRDLGIDLFRHPMKYVCFGVVAWFITVSCLNCPFPALGP